MDASTMDTALKGERLFVCLLFSSFFQRLEHLKDCETLPQKKPERLLVDCVLYCDCFCLEKQNGTDELSVSTVVAGPQHAAEASGAILYIPEQPPITYPFKLRPALVPESL